MIRKFAMGVAMFAAVAVGSAVIANAASDDPTTPTQTVVPVAGSTPAASAQSTDDGQALSVASSGTQSQDRLGRSAETPLTGDTAAKVKKAAEDKVSGGTVERVEADADGVYEAHVRKSDGTEVEVKVNKSFDVTSVDSHGGRDHGGGGPDGDRHGGPGNGEAALTGDTAAKVKKAAEDKVAGGTVERVEADADGVYEAHVRKSDGTEVEVKVNKSFDVTSVEQHDRGDGDHH